MADNIINLENRILLQLKNCASYVENTQRQTHNRRHANEDGFKYFWSKYKFEIFLFYRRLA